MSGVKMMGLCSWGKFRIADPYWQIIDKIYKNCKIRKGINEK